MTIDDALKTLRRLARALNIPVRDLVILPDERDLARPIDLVRKLTPRELAKLRRKLSDQPHPSTQSSRRPGA